MNDVRSRLENDHRGFIAALAAIGVAIAVDLTLFQTHAVSSVWDPIFGAGSQAVLRSSFSRSLPFPDATLGVFAYVADIVLAFCGDPERWRMSPWIAVFQGLLAAGMALASLGLVALQVFVIHAGCLLCLISAFLSFAIAWLALPEAMRAIRILASRRKACV